MDTDNFKKLHLHLVNENSDFFTSVRKCQKNYK